jgi:hypothetical protein
MGYKCPLLKTIHNRETYSMWIATDEDGSLVLIGKCWGINFPLVDGITRSF